MRCPKCHEEIDALNWKHHKVAYGFMKEDGELTEDYPDYENDYIEFFCPECDALLFDNEDDAFDFITGKAEKKELEQAILEEEENDEIVCEENARYRAYVDLKLKEQKNRRQK
jgi:hypothetical protein